MNVPSASIWLSVPARVGGVDLSSRRPQSIPSIARPRPCGRGGFKLKGSRLRLSFRCPRPCGRGGFKLNEVAVYLVEPGVPARVGGVDLSFCRDVAALFFCCPRPCGRGGFKPDDRRFFTCHLRPRPCGRGGFKLLRRLTDLNSPSPRPCGRGGFKPHISRKPDPAFQSPPVWAGWI